ncbi:MAG: hypothetical protein HQ547_00610 [Candidatus Omnitrophica bacterium]|nr:hypothetical protein [Candidatus Omnitrophota bacterium]
MGRHILRLGAILVLCLLIAGCGPAWKKKFVRKKAQNKPTQVFVYEPKEYQSEPYSAAYKRSFLFWKAWQQELIYRLGNSKTSDARTFQEALKNLGEMKECLTEQKASELQGYITKLERFFDEYKSRTLGIVQAKQMRRDLDRLMLKIDKAFRYTKAMEFIKD